METTTALADFTTATGEILVMLAGAFILGWIARWVYELVVYAPLWMENHIDDYVIQQDGTTIRHHENRVVRGETKETSQSTTNTTQAVQENPERVVEAQPVVMQSPEVMPYKQDDLKMVEGIGPKIAQLLQDGGIATWQDLASTDPEDIKTILRAAGERYRIHDPTTWPEQAQLAVEHKWDELAEYQSALSGGKDLTRIYKKTT